MVRDRVNFHFRAPARYNVTLVVQLVAFSLLVAQLMGLMHGVVHNPLCKLETPICRLGYAQPNGRDHYYFAGEVSKADAREGKGLLQTLFSSHVGDADCRLFDQACSGSTAPAVALLNFPLVQSSLIGGIPRGEAIGRVATLFEARGPPLTL